MFHLQETPVPSFRSAVCRLLNVLRLVPKTRCTYDLDPHRRALAMKPTEKEQKFIEMGLCATPVMQLSTCLMFKLQSAIEKAHNAPFSFARHEVPATIMATSLHEIKVLVLRWCWQNHVVEALRSMEVSKSKHESLLKQFQIARTGYLKELTELRTRIRLQHEGKCIASPGSTHFFDPCTTLDVEEQSFVLQCVQERMSLLVDADPTRQIAIGQLERTRETVGNAKLIEATEAVGKLKCQLLEAKAEIRTLCKGTLRQNTIIQSQPLGEKLLSKYEEQNDALSAKLHESQLQYRELDERAKAVEMERDSLARKLKEAIVKERSSHLSYYDATQKLSSVQSDCTKAKAETAELRKSLQEKEEQISGLRYVVIEKDSYINKLHRDVGRSEGLKTRQVSQETDVSNSATHCPSDVNCNFDEDADSVCAERLADDGATDVDSSFGSGTPEFVLTDSKATFENIARTKYSVAADNDVIENDQAVACRRQFEEKVCTLEEQCFRQKELLNGWVRNAIEGRGELLIHEANDLAQGVAMLGCSFLSPPGATNASMPDRASGEASAHDFPTLVETEDLEAIVAKLCDAEARLEVVKDPGNQGGDGVSIEPKKMEEIWNAQLEVGRLRHKKRLADCSLLLTQVLGSTRVANNDIAARSHGTNADGTIATVCCNCSAELESSKQLSMKLQAACAELVQLFNQTAFESAKLGSFVVEMQQAIASMMRRASTSTEVVKAFADFSRLNSLLASWPRLYENEVRRPRFRSEEEQRDLIMRSCLVCHGDLSSNVKPALKHSNKLTDILQPVAPERKNSRSRGRLYRGSTVTRIIEGDSISRDVVEGGGTDCQGLCVMGRCVPTDIVTSPRSGSSHTSRKCASSESQPQTPSASRQFVAEDIANPPLISIKACIAAETVEGCSSPLGSSEAESNGVSSTINSVSSPLSIQAFASGHRRSSKTSRVRRTLPPVRLQPLELVESSRLGCEAPRKRSNCSFVSSPPTSTY
eukprot:TRINITY_DN30783_c0_g1_i1.p1 TRINITY_DN30783_c0_g1~~TRINITY_DN30783_c0_g1_i1.p1  ORF type:complete len:990 (+),score=142.15 TRINITY_DN30783_c0_g1_i1:153-3122(+)